jgi:hypothetical protein
MQNWQLVLYFMTQESNTVVEVLALTMNNFCFFFEKQCPILK